MAKPRPSRAKRQPTPVTGQAILEPKTPTGQLVHEMNFAEFRALKAVEDVKAQALETHALEMQELMVLMGLSTDPAVRYDLRGRKIYELPVVANGAADDLPTDGSSTSVSAQVRRAQRLDPTPQVAPEPPTVA